MVDTLRTRLDITFLFYLQFFVVDSCAKGIRYAYVYGRNWLALKR
jgi:hypothetical protein